jgi:hypothetical protein
LPELPTVVVGDVHGDLERLFAALKPYPPDEFRTVFLGDIVDAGPFGVGALRYARDRPNTQVLLGNHEVALLWALDDPATIASWMGIGGQPHDLKELQTDAELVEWIRNLPGLMRLEDGTLAQHVDHDGYIRLIDSDAPDPVEAVNSAVTELLHSGPDGEAKLWDVMAPGGIFRRYPFRLDRWLERTGSFRIVHGHVPHDASRPASYHDGKAIDFDGRLSRYYRSGRFRRSSPLAASVGVL